MNATTRGLLIAASLTIGSLTLSGCGGQSLASAQDTPEPGSGTPVRNAAPAGDRAGSVISEVTANKELAARVPASLKAQGLKIATAEGYPPMEMFDSDGKTMVGVDMSLARALGNLLGIEVKISNSDVSGMMPGVASGRFDILLSGFNDTAERREKVSFVDYAKSSGALMVAKGNPEGIQKPLDLCGKTVAVLDNGYYMKLAKSYSENCVSAAKGPIKILGFANDPEALLQVKNGRASAGMNDYPVAVFRAKESGGALEAVELDGDSLFGIAVDPGNEELVALLKDSLNKLIGDGTYGKILKAWDLEKMAVSEATVNQGK